MQWNVTGIAYRGGLREVLVFEIEVGLQGTVLLSPEGVQAGRHLGSNIFCLWKCDRLLEQYVFLFKKIPFTERRNARFYNIFSLLLISLTYLLGKVCVCVCVRYNIQTIYIYLTTLPHTNIYTCFYIHVCISYVYMHICIHMFVCVCNIYYVNLLLYINMLFIMYMLHNILI